MRHEFLLADIGEGLEDAEIVTWLVAVGDLVERDQPIVEVMTDKSNAELPAPHAGRILELGGAVGDLVHVGELIAAIETATPSTLAIALPTDPGDEAHVPERVAPPTAAESPSQMPSAEQPVDHPRRRPKASPSTRRLAAERGIDLGTIAGSGPGGRILASDLDPPAGPPLHEPAGRLPDTTPAANLADAEPATSPNNLADAEPVTPPPATPVPSPAEAPLQPPPTPTNLADAEPATPPPAAPVLSPAEPAIGPTNPPNEPAARSRPDRPVVAGVQPLRGIRRAVARNMAQSWSTIPHIHAFAHADAEPLLGMRQRLRDTGRAAYDRLSPLSFFVAAVARALRTHPQANASIDVEGATITYHHEVNVGVAVATEEGLVVPVLRGADQLDFATLSLTLTELVRGARERTLRPEHYLGGTVTVTNFGALGGEQATPLIRPPEAMILGFGSIAERPFVIDGAVVARKTINLVAGADHRLLDGDSTTAVLHTITEALTDPLAIVL